jgi:hypothetical protein
MNTSVASGYSGATRCDYGIKVVPAEICVVTEREHHIRAQHLLAVDEESRLAMAELFHGLWQRQVGSSQPL